MTKKYKVETVGAIIDGKPLGSTIDLTEKVAKQLESIGYVRVISEVKQQTKKATASTKKSVTKKETPKKSESKKK